MQLTVDFDTLYAHGRQLFGYGRRFRKIITAVHVDLKIVSLINYFLHSILIGLLDLKLIISPDKIYKFILTVTVHTSYI